MLDPKKWWQFWRRDYNNPKRRAVYDRISTLEGRECLDSLIRAVGALIRIDNKQVAESALGVLEAFKHGSGDTPGMDDSLYEPLHGLLAKHRAYCKGQGEAINHAEIHEAFQILKEAGLSLQHRNQIQRLFEDWESFDLMAAIEKREQLSETLMDIVDLYASDVAIYPRDLGKRGNPANGPFGARTLKRFHAMVMSEDPATAKQQQDIVSFLDLVCRRGNRKLYRSKGASYLSHEQERMILSLLAEAGKPPAATRQATQTVIAEPGMGF